MAAANPEDLSYKCPVCNHYLEQPKIVPCGHDICRECLISMFPTSTRVTCPLCPDNIVTPEANDAQSFADIVDSLPDDLAMVVVVECAQKLDAKQHCSCESDNPIQAISYCQECNDMLCQRCSDYHGKMKASSRHVLRELSSLTPVTLARSCPWKCSSHVDTEAERFCSDHRVPLCHVCAKSDHRMCRHVSSLDEVFGELDQLSSKLRDAESRLQRTLTKTNKDVAEIDQHKDNVLQRLEETYSRFLKLVELCFERHRNAVVSFTSQLKSTTLGTQGELNNLIGRVVSHEIAVKRVKDIVLGSELFELSAKLASRISDLDRCIPADTETVTLTSQALESDAVTRFESDLISIIPNFISQRARSLAGSTCTIEDTEESPTAPEDPHLASGINGCEDTRDITTLLDAITLHDTESSTDEAREDNPNQSTEKDMLDVREQQTSLALDLLEYDALRYLTGVDFLRMCSVNSSKAELCAQSATALQELQDLRKRLLKRDMHLTLDELAYLSSLPDLRSEGIDAFLIVLIHRERAVVYSFSDNALTKALKLINLRNGQLYKRRRELAGSNDERQNVRCFTTNSGIKVCAYKADITSLHASAIVNSANGHLQHTSGLAAAIAQAAGPALETEGNKYISDYGPIEVTGVVETGAGNLPCQYVLHAVGPRWNEYRDPSQCMAYLARTIFNSLEKAHRLKSFFLVVGSVGAADQPYMPRQLCALMYLAAIQRFEEVHGIYSSLRFIHFVDTDDDMIVIINDTFEGSWETPVTLRGDQRNIWNS